MIQPNNNESSAIQGKTAVNRLRRQPKGQALPLSKQTQRPVIDQNSALRRTKSVRFSQSIKATALESRPSSQRSSNQGVNSHNLPNQPLPLTNIKGNVENFENVQSGKKLPRLSPDIPTHPSNNSQELKDDERILSIILGSQSLQSSNNDEPIDSLEPPPQQIKEVPQSGRPLLKSSARRQATAVKKPQTTAQKSISPTKAADDFSDLIEQQLTQEPDVEWTDQALNGQESFSQAIEAAHSDQDENNQQEIDNAVENKPSSPLAGYTRQIAKIPGSQQNPKSGLNRKGQVHVPQMSLAVHNLDDQQIQQSGQTKQIMLGKMSYDPPKIQTASFQGDWDMKKRNRSAGRPALQCPADNLNLTTGQRPPSCRPQKSALKNRKTKPKTGLKQKLPVQTLSSNAQASMKETIQQSNDPNQVIDKNNEGSEQSAQQESSMTSENQKQSSAVLDLEDQSIEKLKRLTSANRENTLRRASSALCLRMTRPKTTVRRDTRYQPYPRQNNGNRTLPVRRKQPLNTRSGFNTNSQSTIAQVPCKANPSARKSRQGTIYPQDRGQENAEMEISNSQVEQEEIAQ